MPQVTNEASFRDLVIIGAAEFALEAAGRLLYTLLGAAP